MVAIITKYYGATTTRGSRIVAMRGDWDRSYGGIGRISIPYPHERSGEDCYRAAAEALCKKMGWAGSLVGGGTMDGYVFVFVPETVTVHDGDRGGV
jgi:hypothetical protein